MRQKCCFIFAAAAAVSLLLSACSLFQDKNELSVPDSGKKGSDAQTSGIPEKNGSSTQTSGIPEKQKEKNDGQEISAQLPAKKPEPVPRVLSPIDKPAQYFFPHGHNGPLLIDGDCVIRAATWTRGDGIEFFDISDPASPKYTGGILSAGYISNIVSYRGICYAATGFSIFVFKKPENDNPPVLIENVLIRFPEGGVSQLAFSGDSLYCTAPDGLREYSLQKDGRPVYRCSFPSLTDLSFIAVTDRSLFYVRKKEPDTLYQQDFDATSHRFINAPKKQKFQKNISRLMVIQNKIFVLSKDILFDSQGVMQMTDKRRIIDACPVSQENKVLFLIKDDKTGQVDFQVFDGKQWQSAGTDFSRSGGYMAANNKWFVWYQDEGLYFRMSADPGKNGHIPIVACEAPVLYVPPFACSLDKHGNTFRLYGFDVSKPQQPETVCDMEIFWQSSGKSEFFYDIVMKPWSLFLYKERYLFAPNALLDVSNPSKPSVICQIPGYATVCTHADGKNRIWLAQNNVLSIYDGNKLPSLRLIAQIKTDEFIRQWTEFEIDGNYLYAHDRDRLVIYDVTDLQNPRRLSVLSLPGRSYKMVKAGDFLYIPPYDEWGQARTPFRVINVKNPSKPFIANELVEFKGISVLGIVVHNNRLFVAAGNHILVYSLEVPVLPVIKFRYSGPDKAMQSYSYIDIRDGVLVGKKYPRIDVWQVKK